VKTCVISSLQAEKPTVLSSWGPYTQVRPGRVRRRGTRRTESRRSPSVCRDGAAPQDRTRTLALRNQPGPEPSPLSRRLRVTMVVSPARRRPTTDVSDLGHRHQDRRPRRHFCRLGSGRWLAESGERRRGRRDRRRWRCHPPPVPPPPPQHGAPRALAEGVWKQHSQQRKRALRAPWDAPH
jgi:hypothetical protein